MFGSRGWSSGDGVLALRRVAVAVMLVLVGSVSPARAAVFSATPSSVAVGGAPVAVAVGDLDGDGVPDLATANQSGNSVSLRHNDGSANLTVGLQGSPAGTLSPPPNPPAAVAIGDLNADGRSDVVVAGGVASGTTMAIFRALDDGLTFVRSTFTGANTLPFAAAVAIGDLNGDGRLDIAVAHQVSGTATVTLLLRTSAVGSGTTTAAADYARSSITTGTGVSSSVAIGDLNGDGRADLAVANTDDNTVTVLYNDDPSGTSYTPQTVSLATPATPVSVAIGDLDGDGRADLAVANRNGQNVTPLLKNAVGPDFTAATPLVPGVIIPPPPCPDESCPGGSVPTPSGLAIGDLDGDGRNDIAVANTTQASVTVFLKNAAGDAYTATTLTTPGGPRGLAIADLAGSGKLDVVTANQFADSATVLANTTPQGTTTALAAAPASSSPGTAVTFTATVAKVVSGLRGSVAPTGSVTYTVDASTQAPVALSGAGTAVLSTSSLTTGTHTIAAAYSGDANYAASTTSVSYVVTAPPVPPVVTTGAASAVTTSAAGLAGSVDRNGLATTYVFEYGTSLSFGAISSPDDVSASGSVAVSASLTGLASHTTYYYRLVATNSAGTTAGVARSFTTGGAAQAPAVVTLPVTASANTTAQLAGQVNPNGQATAFTFEYGTTTSFGAITAVVQLDSAIAPEPVSASLSGLAPDTTYYYRTVATNVTGTTAGVVRSFTTGPGGAPVVSTGATSALSATAATLAATVDPHGLATAFAFEYGTTNAFGSLSAVDSAGAGAGAQSVTLSIGGLTPGTTYRYRIVATNASGTSRGAVQSFTTPAAA